MGTKDTTRGSASEVQRRWGPGQVRIETSLTKPVLSRLERLAKQNERSVAAEIRVAVKRHLEAAA